MNFFEQYPWPPGPAICYSGFRDGQEPGKLYPSYDEVKEDLQLLQQYNWKYLRLYDCDAHAQTVLDVILREKMEFKLMLGAYIVAEENNENCPWGGGVYPPETLAANKIKNEKQMEQLIRLANKYPDIIYCLSVGNEACVGWTDHLVPVKRVMAFTKKVKAACKQPVTFCENYIPWLEQLKPLADIVDFISIHTYPVWEYKTIAEGLSYTKENYEAVKQLYPDKPVVITEAGWATQSNGRGIDPLHASEENQKTYFEQLMQWTGEEQLLCFFFEAFDENWKGSAHPLEPEKHWGLFRADRSGKAAVRVKAGK